ncbi:pfh1, partial [Symbiodinium necroappetens]
HGNPVEAESIRTAPVTSLPLQYGLNLLQAAADAEPWPVEPQRWTAQPKWRNTQQKQAVRHCPFWTLYGSRGRDPRVHELSAYEFAVHFEVKKATHPYTIHLNDDGEQRPPTRHEAELTDTGKEKVRWHRYRAKLLPGADYRIREPRPGEEWIPFGEPELAQAFKHSWVMVPRKRPYVPVLFGAQGSNQTAEDQAMKLLLLFRPWVNDRRDAQDDLVAFVGDLSARDQGATDWLQAARLWLGRRGFPTESVKRYAAQFCFVHCLPRELRPGAELEANSDNEDLEDDDIMLAMETHVRGEPGNAGNEVQTHADRTKKMFALSQAIWLEGDNGGGPDPEASNRFRELSAKEPVTDHQQVRQAAIDSRVKGEKGQDRRTTRRRDRRSPEVQAQEPVTAAKLLDWLHSDRVRGAVNAKQHEFLELVVDRVMVELNLIKPEESIRKTSEPLVWLLHGPPGVGKSHILQFLRELFEDLLQYTQGHEYEVVALQAVNAADVRGQNIHRAYGFNKNGQPTEGDNAIVQGIRFRRWVIVDEISMVSAKILARMEQRQRENKSSKD